MKSVPVHPFSVALLLVTGIFWVDGFSTTSFRIVKQQQIPRTVRVRTTVCEMSVQTQKTRVDYLRQAYGENSRKSRRSFFTHEDWIEHRAYDRFPETILSIIDSGIVRQLGGEVGLVTVIASVVLLYNTMFFDGFTGLNGVEYEPPFPMTGIPKLVLPAAPFTFSAPALSLLLVFRTNAAYRRWDEARKAWGMIVNHSRNILRQGSTWVSAETEPNYELRRAKLKYFTDSIWAFSRTLQRHLWGDYEDDVAFKLEVRKKLPSAEAEGLIAASHKPSRANNYLTKAVNQLPLTYLRRIEIDKSVIALTDAMGECDRIFSSPVPVAYTRHLARFVGLWLMGLPLCLYEPFSDTWNHFGMIQASALLALGFFGIEELSVQLEEPFSILPLDKITQGIGLSAEEHFEWHFEAGGVKHGRTIYNLEDYLPKGH